MSLLFPNAEETRNVWWKTFISGACAGMISRTCTAPFDRLKTVMQVSFRFILKKIL